MMTKDVNVYLIDFPVSGNEMVIENEDGSYTILINARLSDQGRLHAYEHALRHIEANDFEGGDIQEIESAAHGLPVCNSHTPVQQPLPPRRPRRKRKKSRWAQYDRSRREFFEQFSLPDPRPGIYTRFLENSMVQDSEKD